jgi:hypothetical protein
MDIKETECEDVELDHLAHDTVQWQTLVNKALKLWVPLKALLALL